MAAFSLGDVVKVPFPYTDRPTRQRRPALVVSPPDEGAVQPLLWVLMITSAENRGWPGDVPILNLGMAGLPVPSIVRTAKLATIEARDAEPLGKLESQILNEVQEVLARKLGLATR